MTPAELKARAETDRSRFLATMSHDIRTPLTAMRGALSLIERENVPTHVMDQMIQMMRRASIRVERLAFGLLTIDQIEAGSLTILREVCDLRELVQEAVAITKKEHDLIDVQLPSGRVDVACDRERTMQALDHLLDNARKFGGGDGTISVVVSSTEDRGRVSIADDGPGIRAEDRERVFDRYVQAAERVDNEPRGTGVGLYVARWNAEAMSGRVELVSEEGGAVFELTLPLLAISN